ncbi:MAG: DUF4231 domain-containing protein [Bacteroidota bacterium]
MEKHKKFEGKAYNYRPIGRKNKLLSDQEYLLERVDDQIGWHKRKSVWNKRKYVLLKNIDSVVAALVPISLGIGGVLYQDISGDAHDHPAVWITRGISVLSGVYLAISNGFFELEGYEQKAKDYEKLYRKLESVRFKYLTRSEPYDEEDAFQRLVFDVENTLHEDLMNYFSAMDKRLNQEEEEVEETAQDEHLS